MSVFFLACKGVEPLTTFPENFWTEPPEKAFLARSNNECSYINRGLADHWVYRYEEERLFTVARSEEDLNEYQEKLASLVGYSWQMHGADRPGPFRELLRYAGDFGTIGPIVSAKLADDFTWFDERARTLGDSGFYEWFTVMRDVFQYAANDGAAWYLERWKHATTLPRFRHLESVDKLLLALENMFKRK